MEQCASGNASQKVGHSKRAAASLPRRQQHQASSSPVCVCVCVCECALFNAAKFCHVIYTRNALNSVEILNVIAAQKTAFELVSAYSRSGNFGGKHWLD